MASGAPEELSDEESVGGMPTEWEPHLVETLQASMRGYGVRCSELMTHELLEAIAFSTNLGSHNMYMLDATHVVTYLKGLGPVGVKAIVTNILEKAAPNTPWRTGPSRASRSQRNCEPLDYHTTHLTTPH